MNENIFSLENRKALITGGGSGIGYGIARSFVDAGAEVILLGRREGPLRKACEELGKNAVYKVFDLDRMEDIPGLIQSVERDNGPMDILVNNAGKHHKDYVLETSDEDFMSVIRTNLLAVFSLSRECARYMTQRKKGSIILISSMTAGVAMDKVVGYSASKTALLGMMRTMAVELAAAHVRVNAIAPGWIRSDMLERALNADIPRKGKILSRIPGGQFGRPSDVGNAAVFLASDASSYISNAFIPVDGGAFQAL